nr:glycosyl hydrolase family 65 protein [Promicromonospora sp. MEB111]
MLRLEPRLPDELDALELRLRYRDHRGITVRCDHDGVRLGIPGSQQPSITAAVDGQERELKPGEVWDVPRRPDGIAPGGPTGAPRAQPPGEQHREQSKGVQS